MIHWSEWFSIMAPIGMCSMEVCKYFAFAWIVEMAQGRKN